MLPVKMLKMMKFQQKNTRSKNCSVHRSAIIRKILANVRSSLAFFETLISWTRPFFQSVKFYFLVVNFCGFFWFQTKGNVFIKLCAFLFQKFPESIKLIQPNDLTFPRVSSCKFWWTVLILPFWWYNISNFTFVSGFLSNLWKIQCWCANKMSTS